MRLVPPVNDGDDDDTPGPLLTALRDEDGKFDFSMTNPPFFESTDEVNQGGKLSRNRQDQAYRGGFKRSGCARKGGIRDIRGQSTYSTGPLLRKLR